MIRRVIRFRELQKHLLAENCQCSTPARDAVDDVMQELWREMSMSERALCLGDFSAVLAEQKDFSVAFPVQPRRIRIAA